MGSHLQAQEKDNDIDGDQTAIDPWQLAELAVCSNRQKKHKEKLVSSDGLSAIIPIPKKARAQGGVRRLHGQRWDKIFNALEIDAKRLRCQPEKTI